MMLIVQVFLDKEPRCRISPVVLDDYDDRERSNEASS